MKKSKSKQYPENDKSKYLDGKQFCKRFGKAKWESNVLVWDADANKAVPAKEHPYIQLRLKVLRGEIKPDYVLRNRNERIEDLFQSDELIWSDELDNVVSVKDHPYVIKKKKEVEERNQKLLADPNLPKYKEWLFTLCSQAIKANQHWKEKSNKTRDFHPLMLHTMFGPRMMVRGEWGDDFDDRPYQINIDSNLRSWYESEKISNPEKRLETIRGALGKMSDTEKELLGINKPSSVIEKEYAERKQQVVQSKIDLHF